MSLELEVESVLDKTSTELWKALQNNKVKCLKTEDFRKTIVGCQKIVTAPPEWTPVLSQLSSRLLTIIASGELSMDSQIVASTAYLMVLSLYQDPTNITEFFCEEIIKVTKQCPEISGINVGKPENFKLSLCHGLLQLNYKFWSCSSLNLNVVLFSGIFPVLQKLCYEYNALCFLSFRTLAVLLQKINKFPEKCDIISTENFKQILNIIMANWENPLSGVREQNMMVFEQLLLINEHYWAFLEGQYPNIYHVMTDIKLRPLLELILVEQSWMLKSKYFLLSAVLPRYGIMQALQVYGSDIISGLFLSLKFVHLVSAGADLYRVVLSGLTSQEWQDVFFVHIMSVFNQQSERIQSEHIFSYWLPHTIKKYPEVLKYLLHEVNKGADDVNSQFSYVSLMRLARKEGTEIVDWENLDGPSRELVSALQCHSEPLRSQAFGYVCTSLKTRVLPTEKELNLVMLFLEQNINADNAAFRQNILNSVTTILIRIRDSCLYQMRHTCGDSMQKNQNLLVVFDFLYRLHTFLLGNLEYGSNYQRKYTSMALYKIVLDYLGKNTSITKNTRKSNTKNDGFLISNYGEKIGKWNFMSTLSRNILFSCLLDPADDVRNNASKILMSHFVMNINDTDIFSSIFKKGLSLCSSPMFYEAESGALTVKVVSTLTYNLDCRFLEKILRNVEVVGNTTVVSILLEIAEKQAKQLMNDILCAASQGSPVYGILTSLESLLTDRCSLEFMKLTYVEQQRLISLLEMIVKYILDILSSKSSSDTEFAPSFGEMGLAVSAVARSSSLANDSGRLISVSEVSEGGTYDAESFNLTPCEQLILNCMWLNIKVCCSLSSGLVVSSCLNREETVRCAELLCLVLLKCRHKGAIESAGAGLNRVTRYLTASDNPQLRSIPHDLLKKFLQTIVSTKAATVSRRSAGLAILVHQLVSADMGSGKPLLHYCVTSLIEVISSGEIPADIPLADLPQSQALHFLRTLVQDSSLRQHMASYILDISLLCFHNLSSPIWTVRNAALQLFGGLIPKLIGQKRQQQQEKEFSSGYHLAFEELFHHIKPLFELTKKELEVSSVDSSLQHHSKLMPILTLLCNLTVNVQSLFSVEVKQVLQDFSKHFKSLFKSEIYNVRKLSAKASAWFCFPSNLVSLLKQRIRDIMDYILSGRTICNENELHGYLLNIKYIVERFHEEKVGMRVLLDQETEVQHSLNQLSKVSDFLNKHSFTSRALICNLYVNNTVDPLQCCKEVASILDGSCISLGIPYWVTLHVTSTMQYSDTKKIADVLKFCFIESEHYELQKTVIKSLKTRIEHLAEKHLNKKRENEHIAESVNDISEVLIDFINAGNTNTEIVLPVLETLLLIHQQTRSYNRGKKMIAQTVYNNILFECQLGNKCSSIMLPVLCACVDSNTVSVDVIRSLASKIRMSTDPSNNEDIRSNASKSLKFIFPVLGQMKDDKLCDETGYDLWQSTVNLLQDEDYDVRLEASKFVSSLVVDDKTVQNPYVSLQSVFKLAVLQIFMSESKIIKCLWSKLKYDPDISHNDKELSINPFDHGCINNIYEEETIVLEFVTNSLLKMLTDNSDVFIELINSDLSDVQMQCTKMLNCIQSDKNVSWINLKKNLAQLKILIKIQNNINELETMYIDLEKYKCNVFKTY